MPDPRVEQPVRPTGEGVYYPLVEEGSETDLLENVRRLTLAVANLENAIRSPKRHRPVVDTAQKMTDSSGNAVIPVYQVSQGELFHLTRVVVECATFDATSPRTPAAPYSNASAWFGLFSTPDQNAVGQGRLIDFMPVTAGGQLVPAVAEYPNADGEGGGALVRAGNWLVLWMKSGPASQRVSVNYQGWLESANV